MHLGTIHRHVCLLKQIVHCSYPRLVILSSSPLPESSSMLHVAASLFQKNICGEFHEMSATYALGPSIPRNAPSLAQGGFLTPHPLTLTPVSPQSLSCLPE